MRSHVGRVLRGCDFFLFKPTTGVSGGTHHAGAADFRSAPGLLQEERPASWASSQQVGCHTPTIVTYRKAQADCY